MQENKSITTVKDNIFTKTRNFIKRLFTNKEIKNDVINETPIDKTMNIRTKEELMDIYAKAKKGKYDLNSLDIEDIRMLNKMIETEIEIKTKKLDEIVTDTRMKQYSLE